jgi:hypothetical protein
MIPKKNSQAVLEYLDANVGTNQPYAVPENERTEMSRFNPYYVSTTAQIAKWRGKDDAWSITQSSRKKHLEVECKDSKHETIIAIRWGS